MRVTLIGYWLGEFEFGWPDVHNFVDLHWDRKERMTVIDWLARGVMVRAYPGWSNCRFCGKVNGSSDFSDGVSVWPEGLAHYVKKHHVRLPDEVVRRAEEPRSTFVASVTVNYQAGGVAKSIELLLGETDLMVYDSDWWKKQRPMWGVRPHD